MGMIRSFKDKMKGKQEAYQLEQERLAVIAEQKRKEAEWETFEQEQKAIAEKNQQILAEEEARQHTEYLQWKQEQKILKEQSEPVQQTDSGIGIGHRDTWILTWKSFSNHPDIIDLPMSEKIRLYKLAELRQREKLDYYANLWQTDQVLSGKGYWSDGIVDAEDQINVIGSDTTWNNSVDLNTALIVEPGITLTVLGILTTNALITNYGTIRVEGLIVENVSISNQGAGQVIVG
jgi:hypothetical protein